MDSSQRELGPVQLPTTLPTLDELLGRDAWDASNVHRALLEATDADVTEHVYTLHAELEGHKLLAVIERLLAGWGAQGHTFVN